jgi:hypothetical protein
MRGPRFSIPDEILQDLTMNGIAQLAVHWFYSDTSAERVEFSRAKFENCRQRVVEAIASKGNIYYSSDRSLPEMFERYPVKGKTVAVIGSASPLYEAYVDHFGGIPLTIEYRPIDTDIPNLKTYTVEQVKGLSADIAMSISSIEHSGLGRYGDEIDAEGDIGAMSMIKGLLPPRGLCFLQIPVGTDTVVWNSSRIYGQWRLVRLLRDWEVIDTFGYDPSMLHRGGGLSCLPAGEPIFVLRNADPGLSHKKLFDEASLTNFRTTDARRSRFQAEIAAAVSGFVEIDINYVAPSTPPPPPSAMLSVFARAKRFARRILSS